MKFMFILMFMGEQAVAGGIFRPSQWALAHATFYGDETASATMGMCISSQFITTMLFIIVFLSDLLQNQLDWNCSFFLSDWMDL